MGIHLNPANTDFQMAVNSKIYVDKSELIKLTNELINTENRFVCISRPRRFGKSMAANMLTAYYSRGCDSRELLKKFKIAKADSFEKHLNQYNVIHLNIVRYLGEANTIPEMIQFIEEDIIDEISTAYPDFRLPRRVTLMNVLEKVFAEYKTGFVFVIDEWDCIFRKKAKDEESQMLYLDFLRNLLKDQSYVALAYMTGILPIKKYGEHSALNMFTEISMTDPREYAEFTGFTEDEVKTLCEQYQMSFEETKRWYDGYQLKSISIYNPRSVVMSMTGHCFNNYWTSTETYNALKDYIVMNIDGLRDTIIHLLGGESQKVDTAAFTNDMVTFQTQDDVLTLLVHLGYLTYNFDTKEVSVPNYEIFEQFASTIKLTDWSEVIKALRASDELLSSTLHGDAERVAEMIAQSHLENTSILKYNDENALACVIALAYYSARANYEIIRELPAGKGFADMVFLPRKNTISPAMIVELKRNKTADTAIEQIKRKQYTDGIRFYSGEVLLVGISYDENKGHTCSIEKIII